MRNQLITENVWKQLTRAAEKSRRPSSVAVAFFGRHASRLLPLGEGSRLVVNASEATVKSGLTCPITLLRLHKRGVQIYCDQNLHAKVFVFDDEAFVGSSNASASSETRLKEAILRTTDRVTVNAARDFVENLCFEGELGPARLKQLAKLYRPPRIPTNNKAKPKEGRLRIVHLETGDYPEGSESANEQGRRQAQSRCRHAKTHYVDEFRGHYDSVKEDEQVVQIFHVGNGQALVYPPGDVLKTKNWSNGRRRCTFVYLELPAVEPIDFDKLAKQLGRGSKKELNQLNFVSGEFAKEIRRGFANRRGD